MTDEHKEFTVSDRRRVRDTEGGLPPQASVEEPAAAAVPGKEPQVGEPTDQTGPPPPEVIFASFIFSLAHSAFVHLGEEPDPSTGELKTSLPLAKETIDILYLLDEKTKGNLTPDEEHLMRNLLYTLRMKYVEKATRR